MAIPRRRSRSPRTPRPGRKTEGFTLIELIVVMLVMAIVAVMAVPMAIGTSDFQVISACRMLTADLQYAQNTAITYQKAVTVTFDVGQESYRLSNQSGNLIHPMTKKTFQVNFRTTEGFGDLNIVSANFGGNSFVTFDELGSPGNAGVILLRAGQHEYQITVSSATGKITVTAVHP